MALYGPCVKIVTAQRNTIKINCIPPNKIILHSQFHITTTCHTRQEPIPFYQELIKENKTFLTMFYTLIGFHLV